MWAAGKGADDVIHIMMNHQGDINATDKIGATGKSYETQRLEENIHLYSDFPLSFDQRLCEQSNEHVRKKNLL